MDCTDALFPASQASGSAQPVKESYLLIQALVDPEGFVWQNIGGGYTDYTGAFNISWTAPFGPTEWRFRWVMEHRDGVFRVTDSTGNTTYSVTKNGTYGSLVGGQSVNAGTVNMLGANEPANIYDQAWRAWSHPLKTSTLLLASFFGVKLKWPVGTGAEAYAYPLSKTLTIGTTGWKGSMATAHELGHIASYLANGHKITAMYNWPTSCQGATNGSCAGNLWGFTTNEWRSAAFEEGMAEFIAVGAHYAFNATGPRTCRSVTQNCITIGVNDTRDVEVYSEACNSGQQVMAVLRFLWDTYDNIQDVSYADTLSRSFGSAINTLGNYPNTTTSLGKNEPWNTNLTLIDLEDGRGATAYAAASTISLSTQYAGNCQP
jgi:hypothetical protein